MAVALVLVSQVVGCFNPRRDNYTTTRQFVQASGDRAIWEATQETLRRHRFRLDRVSSRAGIVTTFPVTSQHLFEFWRHDVDTWSDLAESNLNPIRRWVEVHVAAVETEGTANVSIVVHKERLSSPDRQFNSTGAVYQYFGDSLPSTAGDPKIDPADTRWLDVGSDAAMADYLLRKIRDRLEVQAANRPLPD